MTDIRWGEPRTSCVHAVSTLAPLVAGTSSLAGERVALVGIRAYLIKTMSRRRRFGWFCAAAVCGALAAWVASLLLTGRAGSAGRGGIVFAAVLAAVVSAYSFWRATRFRIAREAAEVGGSLTLSTSRLALAASHRRPNSEKRVRRYLVWRPDAPGFLEQLRQAGFQVAGEGAWDG